MAPTAPTLMEGVPATHSTNPLVLNHDLNLPVPSPSQLGTVSTSNAGTDATDTSLGVGSQLPDTARSMSTIPTLKTPQQYAKESSMDDKQQEVWDLVCTLPSFLGIVCMTDGCAHTAVGSWSSDIRQQNYWYTCEECQLKDFGGWPEDPGKAVVPNDGLENKKGQRRKIFVKRNSSNDTVYSLEDSSEKVLLSKKTFNEWLARKKKKWNRGGQKELDGEHNVGKVSQKNNLQGVRVHNSALWRLNSPSAIEERCIHDIDWDESWHFLGTIPSIIEISCMKDGCTQRATTTLRSALHPSGSFHTCEDCWPKNTRKWPEKYTAEVKEEEISKHTNSDNNLHNDPLKENGIFSYKSGKHKTDPSSNVITRIKTSTGDVVSSNEHVSLISAQISPCLEQMSSAANERSAFGPNVKGMKNIKRQPGEIATVSEFDTLIQSKRWDLVLLYLNLMDKSKNVWSKYTNGGTALHEAVISGAPVEVIESITSVGENMFVKDDQWNTPLELALRHPVPSAEVVQVLLENGPNRWSKGKKKPIANPLHLACNMKCSIEIILVIIQAFPYFASMLDEAGNTPLHVACSKNLASNIARTLAEHSPQACTIVNKRGENPLHIACYLCDLETIKSLVEVCPAALIELDHRGYTPEKYAECRNDLKQY